MKMDNSIQIIGRIREKANDFIMDEMKKLGCDDLVPSHGDILASLFRCGELTMTEISESIYRERSTVTTLVNKLVKLGFVKTKKNPEDSRYIIVYLTQKGKELKPYFYSISKKMYEIEYQGISDDEKIIFNELLNKIHNNLKK
jgi:DNA-binding MarR family transcriptional regulator